jgi:hypothetical protein
MTPDSVREQLLGSLLGALDEDEQQAIETRLDCEPALRAELAAVRQQLEPLKLLAGDDGPPPGLAERTCRFVFSHVRPAPAGAPLRPTLSPSTATAGWIGRISWIDVALAITVLACAALLMVPAVQNSRFHGRIAVCKDNLRELGTSLAQYSEHHDGYFPRIPTRGKLAAAGIYAPTLASQEYLVEPQRLVCPGSPLAERRTFRLPTLNALRSAPPAELPALRAEMGGSYAYALGHVLDGAYQDRQNLYRTNYPIMADAPGSDLPDLQSQHHGGKGQCVLFEDGRGDFLASPVLMGGDNIFLNGRQEVSAASDPDDAVIAPSPVPPLREWSERSER